MYKIKKNVGHTVEPKIHCSHTLTINNVMYRTDEIAVASTRRFDYALGAFVL